MLFNCRVIGTADDYLVFSIIKQDVHWHIFTKGYADFENNNIFDNKKQYQILLCFWFLSRCNAKTLSDRTPPPVRSPRRESQ